MYQKIPLPAIVAIVLLIVLVFIFATLDNDYDAIEQQIATTTINGDTSAENADSVDGASEGTDTAPEVTEVGSETVTAPVVTPLAPAPVAPEPVQPAPTADTSDATVAPVSSHAAFMQCLADAGVVIYGSRTCPACARLSQEYGGYDKMSPVYVECTVYSERCQEEMLVNYVPAVQIRGELYEGWGSPENLATVTGCPLPQ